jgi:hypothetical protein
LKGWKHESSRHALAARGIKTANKPTRYSFEDSSRSDIGMYRFNHVIDLLTEDIWKDLISTKDLKVLEKKIRKYQPELIKRGKNLGYDYLNDDGTLCCEHSVDLMGLVLMHWNIPYMVIFGYNNKNQTHVWIRVNTVTPGKSKTYWYDDILEEYDPSGQGMGPGYGIIVEEWDPKTKMGYYTRDENGNMLEPEVLLEQLKKGHQSHGRKTIPLEYKQSIEDFTVNARWRWIRWGK